MERQEIIDFNGKILKVGDKVIMGDDWAKGCDWLKEGTVINIDYKPIKTIATIEITREGLWGYNKNKKAPSYRNTIKYEVPRTHDNIYIIR